MNNITEKDMSYWWCQLNRYEFDGFKTDHKATIGAMKFIEAIIGKKACLEEWNRGGFGDFQTNKRKEAGK